MWITSWCCEQCLQRVLGVMRDPRWCDGWSNVNGVRRHPPAQFWEAEVGGGGHNPKMPEVAHRPSPSPPCAIPHRRALRILQLPRLLLLGAFQARAVRANARNAGWALALHCRWACALLQPASASADSFFWGHCASAKAESLAEKGKKGKLFQEAASGFRAVRMAP